MKYKLIKEHPGIDLEEGDCISGCYYLTSNMKIAIDVRNFPKYWEKVIEKDYKIIDFTSPHGPILVKGKYEPGYKIHSVKRLSDGEIFTIGDKIRHTFGEIFIINSFDIGILGDLKLSINGKQCALYNAHHYKPLFTTEDGLDIFKHDNVWWVAVNEEHDTPSGDKTWSFNKFLWKGIPTTSKNYKCFSTQEAVEEYILMNKPCLSINDCLKIKKSWYANSLSLEQNLKDLVKSKL